MQSANLSGPFRGCLYYALLGLPQATGLAGGYDLGQKNYPGALPPNSGKCRFVNDVLQIREGL